MEPQMYKNQLQEYTQKSGLPLPIYHTTNEGFQHATEFRSSVLVDGATYGSGSTFAQRKEAEQDAAKFALECIKEKIEVEECPTIYKDLKYCKSILQELSVKMDMDAPKYTTTEVDELRPVFVSTLLFNGSIHRGKIGGSKKEAEQLAARTAIEALLESDSGVVLREIINSKVRIHSSLYKIKKPSCEQNNSSIVLNSVVSSQQKICGPSSTVTCRSMDAVKSSWETKRKYGDTNPVQKKMRSYGQ